MTLELIDHENLSRTVYATLCDAIMKGRFRPGDRLKIRDLAEKLGTSVTPVRDAILRLAHDEAVVFQSSRDIRIPQLSQERYQEIRSIRLKLEGLAAENAARLATTQDIKDLERLVADNESAMKAGDGALGSALNQKFHFQLIAIAHMPVLRGVLQRMWLQMGPIISDVYLAGGRSMIEHHYPVIKALAEHDEQAASQAIMDDITHGGQAIAAAVATVRNAAALV